MRPSLGCPSAISGGMNCGVPTACAGPPRWRLFAYLPLRDLTSSADSPFYVVAFLSGTQTESGAPLVTIRAESFGPRSAHQAIELTVSRSPEGEAVVLTFNRDQLHLMDSEA